MLDLENISTKEDIIKEFFTWLFDDSRIKNHSITLQKETDLTLVKDYNDPNIYFPNQIYDFFQTQAMKRLGRVGQLFFTVNIFPNTYHNRLEHSKGVYNRKVEEFIYDFQQPEWKNFIESNDLKLTLIAELIKVAGHDIGHFPLSHAFEEQVFQTHGAHEIIGQRLMLENPEIQSVLLSISDDLPEVLSSLYSKPVLNFPAHDESSYDVDRLDYVSRDALYKGNPISLHTAKYSSTPRLSTTDSFVDVYDKESIANIEELLKKRNEFYSSLYMSESEQSLECAVGAFFNVLLDSSFPESGSSQKLPLYLRYLKSVGINGVNLDDFLKWDDVSLYSEIFDIAENCPDSNIRHLATLTIPKLDSFFNILYSHLDCKNTHSYSSEDLQFLSHIKSLLKGNSTLIRDLTNPDFLNDNIVFLTHSPLKDDLAKRGLISSFSYKFKTYNPNEPVYVEDDTSKFVELSDSPKSTIDWENSKKLFSYNFAYIPFLRFKGLSDAEISSIRASGVRPDIKTSHSAKVNMSPLSVEHSVRDYFKNMDIDER